MNINGEIVAIDPDLLREDIERSGYSMAEMTEVLRGYYFDKSYISHRLRKGKMPVNVLKEICRNLNKNYEDYLLKFDLSDVSSEQMIRELKERGRIK
jgi:hypothetical protein